MALGHYVILALCSALVSAGWQTNLQAAVNDGPGGNAVLKVTWNKGSVCFWTGYTYTVYFEAEHLPAKKIDTGDLSVTFDKAEYWTNYTITCEAECHGDKHNISINSDTGPGSPHPVSDVTAAPSTESANINITEAQSMPRPVEQYNVTHCRTTDGFCQSTLVPRNGVKVDDSTPLVNLTGLAPNVKYNVTVAPQIPFQNKTYVGDGKTIEFTTKSYDHPAPTVNVTSNETNDDVTVTVTWKLEKDNGPAATRYLLHVKHADGETVYRNFTTGLTATVGNLSIIADYVAEVTPSYNYSGYFENGTMGSKDFQTPGENFGPPKNFQFALLNTTKTLIGWDHPDKTGHTKLFYNITVCLDKDHCTDYNNHTNTRLAVDKLTSNTKYSVNITACVFGDHEACGNASLTGTFVTLEKDYAAVSDISAAEGKKSKDTMSYSVNWETDATQTVKADNFTVSYCDSSEHCMSNTTKDKPFDAPLGYFEKYTFNVSANYYLNLGAVEHRENKTSPTVETPGTEPDVVQEIEAEPTNTTARLVWKPAANVPVQNLDKKSITYTVMNPATNEEHLTNDEVCDLRNLAAYTKYNISFQMFVDFKGIKYNGTTSLYELLTDVGIPGNVSDIQAIQKPDTKVFIVTWKAPAADVAKGPITYYNLNVYDPKNATIFKFKVPGTTNVTLSIPKPVNNASYTFGLSAVNVNRQQEHLAGDELTHTVQFNGIASPVNATLVNRTGESLLLQIEPAKRATAVPELIYRVTVNSTGVVTDFPTPLVNVTGLKPNSTETVFVQACALPDLCSDKMNATFETNYGRPSPVKNLQVQVAGEDQTELNVTWDMPEDLNGPLDGYRVEITATSANGKTETVDLSRNQTAYSYPGTDEYETYNVTVVGYNNDRDVPTSKILGERTTIETETSGTHPVRPMVEEQTDFETSFVVLSWKVPKHDPKFDAPVFRIVVADPKIDIYTEEHSHNITDLKPYKTLNVTLYGCTSNNTKAQNCSQPRMFTRRTDVDEPTIPRDVKVTNLGETSADVQWTVPDTPNGPIHHYRVDFWEASNNETKHSRNITGTDLKSSFKDLKKLTAYKASITAININSHSVELYSPTATTNFSTVAPGGGFPVWLIVLLCIALVGAVVAVGVIYMRRRQPADDTQNLVRA